MENPNATIINVDENGVLTVKIPSKEAMFAAHMPFIKGGGIFIETKRKYELGEEVQLLLILVDENDQIPVKGKIVWLTPTGAQSSMNAGIGVGFVGDNASEIRKKIDTHTAGMSNTHNRTDTM